MSWDQELQEYLGAIVSARAARCIGVEQLQSFLDCHFKQADAGRPSTNLSESSQSYMLSIMEATDFFTEFSVLMFAKGHGLPRCHHPKIRHLIFGRPEKEKRKLQSTVLPLSMCNKQRIRRALLRFQLYCELFHQPGDSLDRVDDWEERLPEQEYFWMRYEWWEVEGVKCIYQIIVLSLENSDLGLSRDTYNSRTEELQEGHLQERGLPQLRHFLDGTQTTLFGESYRSRFLSRAFHGFSRADPDDLNWFSQARPLYKTYYCAAGCIPPGTYRSLKPSPNKSRKWKPSPYPGVQLEHITDPILNPHLPTECLPLASSPKDLKRFVRQIGWVFWDKKKLPDWVEFGKSFTTFRLEAGDFDQEWYKGGQGKPFRWEELDKDSYDD